MIMMIIDLMMMAFNNDNDKNGLDDSMMTTSGRPTTADAKSNHSMFEGDALHLHEPGRLELRLWMVLRLPLAGPAISNIVISSVIAVIRNI